MISEKQSINRTELTYEDNSTQQQLSIHFSSIKLPRKDSYCVTKVPLKLNQIKYSI